MKRVAHVDHIQLAAPKGCERAAREFYGSILGVQEVEKPLALHARAKKAHPAFVVFSLDELQQALLARGIRVVDGEDLPERRRFFANDPWGNRIEFVEMQR